jgi:hypothetical protein
MFFILPALIGMVAGWGQRTAYKLRLMA